MGVFQYVHVHNVRVRVRVRVRDIYIYRLFHLISIHPLWISIDYVGGGGAAGTTIFIMFGGGGGGGGGSGHPTNFVRGEQIKSQVMYCRLSLSRGDTFAN